MLRKAQQARDIKELRPFLTDVSEEINRVAQTEIVVIEFSTDMPIKLNFQQEKEGKLKYYLAPRIEVE